MKRGATPDPEFLENLRAFYEKRGFHFDDTAEPGVKAKEAAHPVVRDAMDIALLTGQRPADVLKIKRADIHDGALWIVQNKTGAKRAIEVTGELKALIDRMTPDHVSASARF